VVTRVQGSSLFERGEKQILKRREADMLSHGSDDRHALDTLTRKRLYMHHYNFPPYSDR